ncbi:MAG: hypothetical protein JWO84_513 [Parcubacteria group bacterium]|nr:hypothetical protein [Parcubacteria group bacterium]
MKYKRAAMFAAVLSLLSTSAAAELQVLNTGSLGPKEAQEKFAEAWKTCSAEMKAGSSQAALYACINKKLEPFKLKAVNN